MAFENPAEVIEAFDYLGLVHAFKKIEQVRETHTLIGYIRYEAKHALLDHGFRADVPLLYFEAHTTFAAYVPTPRPDIPLTVTPAIDFTDYERALSRIKEEIADGNTYQVNYT
ncbi:MAG: hypothetical protein WCJ02_16280, partial [bacterium]